MWEFILSWMKENQVGDISGVIGLIITLFGFAATLVGVSKSKASADRAEKAARKARDSIKLFDTLIEFTAAIAILEEIKRHHRQEQWHIILDRYGALRKILITIRVSNKNLTDGQQKLIQSALTNLAGIEQEVEKKIENPSSLKASKLNVLISRDADNLITILAQIKSSSAGV